MGDDYLGQLENLADETVDLRAETASQKRELAQLRATIAAKDAEAQGYWKTMQRQNEDLRELQEAYKRECERSAVLRQDLIDIKRNCDPSGQYPELRETIKQKDAEIERLEKENTCLRGVVAKANIACVYCGKENIAECPSGFPGCAQADDMMAGEDEMFRRLCAERKQQAAELARLRALCGRAVELDLEAYGAGVCYDIDDRDNTKRNELLAEFEQAANGGEG